jgi:metallo-beta-lactamase class B
MRSTVTAAHLARLVALVSGFLFAPTSFAQHADIPADSPLRRLDADLVRCGKELIAQMDAARITTTWEHEKFPAFHVFGNTYSVGIRPVTAYLVKTSDGLILIDTTFAPTAPWVAESIQKLGFNLADIKIILGSHAHGDHQGGNAWMKEHAPKAQLMVMDADVAAIEKGLKGPNGAGDPPAKVDRILHDGDKVTLGDVSIAVWKTAGHTPGATSFEWRTSEGSKTYDIVVVGSQQPATQLVPEGYPGIVADQANAWTRLRSLRPDIWFGGHSWQHANIHKYEQLLVKPGSEPFVDPKGYRCLTEARTQEFVDSYDQQVAKANGR